jgi:HEAT repeat protein
MRRFHPALGLSFACAGLMSLVVGCTTLRLAGMANSPTLVAATSPPPSPALLEAIRTSLSVEAWRFNRGWTAEAEWESRGQRFPAPSTLRWSFGKNAEAVTEKPPFEDLRISKSANRGKTNPKASQSQPNKSEPAPKTETAEASNTATQSDGAADPKSADAGGDENSVAWDGFWPLTVSDLVHRHEHREGRAAEAAAATVDDGMRCLHRLARVDSLAGWNAAILWGQHDPQSAVEIVDVLERLVIKPPLYVAETGEPDSGKPEGTKAAPSTASKDSNAANDAKHKAAENPPPHRPTRRIAPATQAAAAEAWCLVLSASAGQAVDGLAPAGRALERVNLPNSVRGEVFRGVSAWVPPAHIPRLENALRQGEKKTRAPADIRQAAIEGCLIYAINRERADQTHSAAPVPARAAAASKRLPSDWPSTVMNCRIDPDFQVRRTFIQWLGRARPDGAFELLKTQAESAEVALRAAALESLGRLHTEAAHAEIKSQADKTRDTLRAAAVGALSGWGIEEVAHYAHDKSQVVRMAVARELGKQPTLDSAVLLTAMVVDPSLDVQLVAVDAVKTWPNDVAFPLLLHAMRDSSAKTRMAAFGQVSQRKKVDVDYRFDGPPDQRQASVNAVAAAVGSSLSYLDQMLRREPRAGLQVNALRVSEIREHLTTLIENPSDSAAATSAREWLTGIGPKDLPVVEAFLKSPTKASPEAIYRDVLSRISPVYAALVDLESSDLTVRRRGARTLADRGQAVSLSRPVLSRLQERLYRENDELVWRWALSAIGSDSTEDCAEIANLGLHHQAAEVRQLACEYLGRHGQPAYAVSLLNLLDDRDRGVKLAAIRALGNCGNQIAVRGLKPDKTHNASPNLRSLLSSSDGAVQFAAAVSLCRLGTAEGMQELVRLSYHANSDMREQAVKEMGLSGQTRFVSHLVTLGWTERNGQVRQAILDSLDRLVPEENRPRPLGETPAPDAKIKCWVEWLQQRGGENGAATASAPAGRPSAAAKGPTPGGPVVSRPDEG